MAVKDETIHHATEDLILAKPRKYFALWFLPSTHWQLRSLISSPQQDIVYYASGSEVFRLNTKKGEKERIASLSFAAKCLSASKEWLCCGGDDGNYITICLDQRSRNAVSAAGADADARLPLDLDPSTRTMLPDIIREASSTADASSASRRSREPLPAKTTKFGTDLVNSIGLWSPSSTSSGKAYKVPVALVSNNDRTVTIVDIAESDILEELSFPDCVNRAVMSEDGEMLVVVGDDPYLYVHERVQKPTVKSRQFNPNPEIRYQWVLRGRVQLEGQKQADKSSNRGSFAVSFSNSGKYLAVATQHGLISIFDTATLAMDNVDSLMVVFTTSRPGREAARTGGVRAMAFSPGPFDLLAWTEATGRVGIADVRNLFLSRQLIIIDSHAEGVESVFLSERTGDTVIDPRLRSLRADSPSSSSSTPDYLGLDLERRQLRHLTREMMDRHQEPLTTEELEVLQAHRIARRTRDLANAAREARIEAIAEAATRSSPWADGQRSSVSTNSSRTRSVERRISTANLPPILREFVNPERSATSIRSYINDRNQDRERRSQTDLEPRRLNLIQLAAAESATERERETLGPNSARNGTDTSSRLERLTLMPPRLPPVGTDSPNNPWAELDALYRSRYPADPPIDRSTRLRVEIEDEDRRDFANRLRQPWRPIDDLTQTGRDGTITLRGTSPAGSAETVGLSWSPDGRILYAGAQDGIYEYHVNIAGRKKFPSLVFR